MTSVCIPSSVFGLEWTPVEHPYALGLDCWTSDVTDEYQAARDAAADKRIPHPPGLENYSEGRVLARSDRFKLDEFERWCGQAGTAVHILEREAATAAIEKRERQHAYAGPRHVTAVKDAIAEAESLYAEYGAACIKPTEMLRLVELRHLYTNELKRLRKLIDATKANVAVMDIVERGIKAKPSEVYLDDEFVERAIRVLTDLDRDRAKEGNRLGWGRDTTGPGHWCFARLKTDRDEAIEIGRVLVSNHLVQLKKLGVVPSGMQSHAA